MQQTDKYMINIVTMDLENADLRVVFILKSGNKC